LVAREIDVKILEAYLFGLGMKLVIARLCPAGLSAVFTNGGVVANVERTQTHRLSFVFASFSYAAGYLSRLNVGSSENKFAQRLWCFGKPLTSAYCAKCLDA
jgi:hypothetical protein